MKLAQMAYAEQYRASADAFHAMADRLILEGEMTLALEARNEAKRQEGLAAQVEAVGLDNNV